MAQSLYQVLPCCFPSWSSSLFFYIKSFNCSLRVSIDHLSKDFSRSRSCLTNPRLGAMTGLALVTISKACLRGTPYRYMMYPRTMVGERDTPARLCQVRDQSHQDDNQCTSTFPPEATPLSMNLNALSQYLEISNPESSSISSCKYSSSYLKNQISRKQLILRQQRR